MAKGRKIRILIGDSQPIFRTGLRRLLSKEADLNVIGEAENGAQALKLVAQLRPEIVILDLPPGGTDELDILQELQQRHKNTKVIILAASDKEENAVKAMRLGTAGVVPKHASLDVLIECIRKVEAGEIWLDTRMTAAVVKEFSSPSPLNPRERDTPSLLSARERQVVALVSQGFKNKEIAQRMFISEQTVKNHLHNIFDKLGVSDRLELALYAIHKNLQAVP